MSNDENYESISKRQWADIPDPATLPEGTYKLRARNGKIKESTDADKSDQAIIIFSVVEPFDDVHEDDLAVLGDNYDFSGNRIFHRQFLSDSNDSRSLKTLLSKLGIVAEPTETPEDTLKRVKGQEVVAYLKQRTYKNNAGINVTENVATDFRSIAD